MALHPYSLDDSLNASERLHVAYKLATGASILVGAISALLATLTQYWPAIAALAAPSTIIVYLSLVRAVESYLWNWKPARRLLGITLPDVNGTWTGQVATRRRDGVQIAGNTGRMTIKQTWSTIGVEFETDRTCSHSIGAFFSLDAAHLILTIEYRADVRKLHKEDPNVRAHRGTCRYRIRVKDGICDLDDIEVPYYTDHRETGVITLRKI
ncbi:MULTISPECIES: Cap15 family cyclic dinucleotide receptor domain-containing protein [Azotobacter]|uniref:Cap15 family cyclic dinucleotide receptor domain-containing protein n=1 Tax=Azotobacter TaxID=352 RepID=UPI0000526EF7|nr:hypothetical protein [Azotobacter vinelandii]WKN22122.1 hypothetical protein AVAEIV_000069 [Azotobacter vinelandii]GLK61739.1 hypothetical protein GCM10017624_39030 [Azotobacter vinelandii]SFY33270.1 hypothetical protein SAMN04244547_05149 [Azotobacter vinelandii]